MKNTLLLPYEIEIALQDLGAALSRARRVRGESIEIAAQRLGVHRTTISRIEKGDPAAGIGIVFALMHCYGMTPQVVALSEVDPTTKVLLERRLPKRVRLAGASSGS